MVTESKVLSNFATLQRSSRGNLLEPIGQDAFCIEVRLPVADTTILLDFGLVRCAWRVTPAMLGAERLLEMAVAYPCFRHWIYSPPLAGARVRSGQAEGQPSRM
jgi:hypothetical protein